MRCLIVVLNRIYEKDITLFFGSSFCWKGTLKALVTEKKIKIYNDFFYKTSACVARMCKILDNCSYCSKGTYVYLKKLICTSFQRPGLNSLKIG